MVKVCVGVRNEKLALYILSVLFLFVGMGCGGININYKCPNQTPLDTTAFVDRPEEMVMIKKESFVGF